MAERWRASFSRARSHLIDTASEHRSFPVPRSIRSGRSGRGCVVKSTSGRVSLPRDAGCWLGTPPPDLQFMKCDAGKYWLEREHKCYRAATPIAEVEDL